MTADGEVRAGPLAGVVVIDLTRVVAGPYCSMMFADLGATVIKIEHPTDPDYVRSFPPFIDDGGGARSGFFAQYNRGKLGAHLDLKDAEGKRIFLRMIAKADVLIENFRPGTMEKLGLGHAVLREANPRLVYTAISGFGHSGPNSLRPSFDNNAQAAGGLWSMNGEPDDPVRVGTIIGDLAASLYGAFGTLAALRQAEATGVGQMVDISQQDAVLSLTENAVVRYTMAGEVARPLGNEHPFVRPYGRYPCKDGYVFFGAYTDKFWAEACRLFGTPEHARDPEIDTMAKRFDLAVYERRIRPIVEAWCGGRTKEELEEIAGDRFPLSPIKTIDEVVNDPHIRARGMIVPVAYGGLRADVFGSPVKLSDVPPPTGLTAPLPGEDNEQVFLSWLGLAPTEYAALRQRGVV
ncbi:CaiB/BaiF CoA-transferase family protein [Pelomonas sp. KK5]|uniref:CaiB/BaiF CoA transferase family protein n=1 Tax=Pelomonas sp. KK5 TaxID=1855730 RepID=UPI00097C18BE|nr:CoA transferase [Pelomonas sp. KK5]